MRWLLGFGAVAVGACVAVAVFAGRGQWVRPPVTAARPAPPGPTAPGARDAATVVRAFAEAWWSYDWRQGWAATARAAAVWETAALAAATAGPASAPAWDTGRAAAGEEDRPLRVDVTLEDQAPGAIGFAVAATVEVARRGAPNLEVQRDAEVLVRRVDGRWCVAAVQQ